MIRKKLIDRDTMNAVSRSAVSTAMVRVFDVLQGIKNEVQLLALTGAFALMSEVTEVTPQDAQVVVSNLMRDPDHNTRREPRFAAMKYHLESELTKGMR